MRTAALASRAENQDSIDLAVLGGVKDPKSLEAYHVTHFVPFDPVHKRTEAAVEGPGGGFSTTKGAVQVILDLASPDASMREKVQKAVDGFAARGFRSLGVARKDGEDAGGSSASSRFSTRSAMTHARPSRPRGRWGSPSRWSPGTRPRSPLKQPVSSTWVTNIVDAARLVPATRQEVKRPGDESETADGFAQVFPEHKFHIVDVLQKRGHIVGMTGDGVNDAPALKKADVGIAVSGATDAARSAAAIVLLSAGLSVIVDAIRESRKIFQRMTNYAMYRIAETIRVLLFMTLSILVFNFYPVTAVMIVLLALLNDGAIISIAFDRARASEKPVAWDMRTVLGMALCLALRESSLRSCFSTWGKTSSTLTGPSSRP